VKLSLLLAFFWRMAFLLCSSFELSIMGSMAAGPAKSGRSFYANGHWVAHENTTTPCMQCLLWLMRTWRSVQETSHKLRISVGGV
jgi:hypothetical protein